MPGSDLHILFETASVDLVITNGGLLDPDPGSDQGYDQYETTLRPPSPVTKEGVFIVGWMPQSGDADIYGETFGDYHGLSVVYAHNATNAGTFSDSLFLQVCAHEIGHLCNLTHGDDPDVHPFTSIMLQARERGGSTQDAWQAAQQQALHDGDSTWKAPAAPIDCYPFGPIARQKLAAPASGWAPWSGLFAGAAEGTTDSRLDRGLVVTLHPHRSECGVGDDVAFDVNIKNIGRRMARLPLNLHPRFANLDVSIEGPDGILRRYRPHSIACSDSIWTIRPGEHAIFPLSLLGDAQGLLLAREGLHTVHVALRTPHGVSSRSTCQFQLVVRPRKTSRSRKLTELTPAQIGKHVARGADLGAIHHLAAAAAVRNPGLLEIAGIPTAPRAVRHAAALLRVAQAVPSERPRLIQESAERHATDRDRFLRLKLSKFEMGNVE